MDNCLLSELERTFKKCSDCILDTDYITLLNKLCDLELSQELIDYLCDKITFKKLIWEIRFEHLRILLLNPSAKAFNLKSFYFENLKKCRKLAMKIFYIRGYALYSSEDELNPIMDKLCSSLEKNHDYIDYNYILSVAGLPYLADTYGYNCFVKTLRRAEEEHKKIDSLLQGYFTLNSNLEQVDLLSIDEVEKRMQLFLEKIRNDL